MTGMRRFFLLISLLSLALGVAASAQQREVPYWASLRHETVNMRVGPSQDYRIDWVYKRKGMPLKIIRKVEDWRLIRDPDGAEGWVAASQLKLTPGAMVIGEEPVAMRDAPADNGKLRWRAAPGVVGLLGDCEGGWCQIDIEGRAGWISQDRLWGAGAP